MLVERMQVHYGAVNGRNENALNERSRSANVPAGRHFLGLFYSYKILYLVYIDGSNSVNRINNSLVDPSK